MSLLRIVGKDVRAFTRGGLDWSDRYQGVIDACRNLRCRSGLIDGEIIVQDKNGLSDFAVLRAAIDREPHRLVLFAFDLLFLNGSDVRRLSLIERREKLRQLIPVDDRCPIQFNDHYEGKSADLFKEPAPWVWKAWSRRERSVPTKRLLLWSAAQHMPGSHL